MIDAVLVVLMAYPLASFVRYGWSRRAAEILDSLNEEAKQRYLSIFRKQSYSEAAAVEAFRKLYVEQYGLKHYVIPFLLLLIVAAVGDFYFARALQDLIEPGVGLKQFNVAAAAIAGAYTSVCWDFYSRMQRLTLARADILRATLRLVIALPVGFAFATLLNESLAPFVAFAMGAFPVQTINTILQRQMKKRLQLELTAQAARDQVFLLSGIDTPIAERIEDADITTITQLAWADPVGLTMRTNLQFAFVIDIISQALAWVYLEGKLQPMGVVGLHGAVEIRILCKDLGVIEDDEDDDAGEEPLIVRTHEVVEGPDEIEVTDSVIEVRREQENEENEENGTDDEASVAAKAALKAAAKIAKVDEAALKYAFLQIGEDPTAEFLEVCWNSLTSGR